MHSQLEESQGFVEDATAQEHVSKSYNCYSKGLKLFLKNHNCQRVSQLNSDHVITIKKNSYALTTSSNQQGGPGIRKFIDKYRDLCELVPWHTQLYDLKHTLAQAKFK